MERIMLLQRVGDPAEGLSQGALRPRWEALGLLRPRRPPPRGKLFGSAPHTLVWNPVGAQFSGSKRRKRLFCLPEEFRGAREFPAFRRTEDCRTHSAMESVVRPSGPTVASSSEAPPPLAQRGAGPTGVGRGSESGLSGQRRWRRTLSGARGLAGKWTQREVPGGWGSRRT